MHFSKLVAILGLVTVASCRSPRHVNNKILPERSFGRPHAVDRPVRDAREERDFVEPEYRYHKRAGPTVVAQNRNTTKYAVDGTAIPDVDFDIGESYAGLMPINKNNPKRQLYFWYFPSTNPAASDEITIWLNGGPGCSSLEGLLQENGPFIWQYGTYKPVKNPYTWVNLTNMLWVEQPVGTGFSTGDSSINKNEKEVAKDFLGFFKNFVDTFGLHNRKIYVTGESYAGYYVPYIADAMHNAKNTRYYDVKGILIYDPSTSSNTLQTEVPAIPFVDYHMNLFHLNNTYMNKLRARDQSCGYAAFRDVALRFPPSGPLPSPPNADAPGCDVATDIFNAISLINPCFDIYQVATTCPLLWDVLGFPGSFDYLPEGAPDIYFNRPEVKRAINAPQKEWAECSNGVLDVDNSPPSGLSVLPGLIDKNERTIIGHGQLDMVLIPNGTLMMIQNMTWGGKQGFQREPDTPFFVPYHSELSQGTLAGAGRMGTTHTERKLTWVEIWLSGHMVPQYAPSAAYRHLEYLLGRISSLNERSSFTTQRG